MPARVCPGVMLIASDRGTSPAKLTCDHLAVSRRFGNWGELARGTTQPIGGAIQRSYFGFKNSIAGKGSNKMKLGRSGNVPAVVRAALTGSSSGRFRRTGSPSLHRLTDPFALLPGPDAAVGAGRAQLPRGE